MYRGWGTLFLVFPAKNGQSPKSHTQKSFLSNGKIVYYQDVHVPQLPVSLNTLHI